jgi:hypothetical protein
MDGSALARLLTDTIQCCDGVNLFGCRVADESLKLQLQQTNLDGQEGMCLALANDGLGTGR